MNTQKYYNTYVNAGDLPSQIRIRLLGNGGILLDE